MTRLDQLLLESANHDPDRLLFIKGTETHSYGEVAARSRALASALASVGVAPGDRVAIVLDNSVAYLIATYGALMAGAVVVPLCSDTRSATLLRPLAHARAKLVILAGRLQPLLAGIEQRAPDLQLAMLVGSPPRDDPPARVRMLDFAELTSGPDAVTLPDVAQADLASLMYTSGTTAAPKAAMLSHGNLLANTRSIVEYLELGERDRAALVLPLYYSYGISVLHTHVQVGASIVAAGSVAFPAAVFKQIEVRRCTGLPGVPSTFARLLDSPLMERANLSSLRYTTQAGGPMSPALTRRLRKALPKARLFIMYGQTEAAPRLSYLPPQDLERKLGSAGKAIPGVELEVVDESGKPVPNGTTGELVARGANIMLGYWEDEAATARALRPEGLRTGDLAQMDVDGFIYIVGRKSDQIKSGAHRISPAEIEETLAQHPGIRESAVVGRPDELLGEAIVAFVVPITGTDLSERDVLRHCFEHLPKFKQPQHVRLISAIPRTPTGKIRRAALRQMLDEQALDEHLSGKAPER
jgi:long-chain acyl-CoA synthetase